MAGTRGRDRPVSHPGGLRGLLRRRAPRLLAPYAGRGGDAQGPGLRPPAGGEGDRPGHLPGHGGPHPQPEHHALPGRGPDPLLLHQLRHGHLPRGAHGDEERPAGHRGRPGQRGDPHLPHPDLPGEGGVNYNPGEPNYDLFQLAIRCSAKRLFPNFSFHGRPLQPAVLQARPPGDRDRLHGLPHPGHRQRVRPGAGDLQRPGQPLLYHHQPAPAGHQGQGGPGRLLRGAGPDAGPVRGPAAGAV